MSRFFKKILSTILIYLIPAIAIIFIYVVKDIYCDFGIDQKYSLKYWFNGLGDFSTKKLIHQKNKIQNTFIFGSSRSSHFYGCYLQKKVIHSTDCHPYYYGNWGESIGGIERKLHFLDSSSYSLKRVLIILDGDITFRGDGSVQPYDHYLLTGKSRLESCIIHAKDFFSIHGDSKNDRLKIFLGIAPNPEIIFNKPCDDVTNDLYHLCNKYNFSFDSTILTTQKYKRIIDSLQRNNFLYERPNNVKSYPIQLSTIEKNTLVRIKKILNKHTTKYAIVISPLYDQKKLHPEDLKYLKHLFGEKLLDLSGKNWITNNEIYYPDKLHFTGVVSKYIMDSIGKLKLL